MTVQHVLSFDVENWYDGNLHRTLTGHLRDDRVVHELVAVLDLLDEFKTRATFFILGEVAEAHPELVREIAARGHEVGCHAQEHLMLHEKSPERYLADLVQARARLQDLSGQAVLGHRAPSWSVNRKVPWAPDVIQAAGFTYDSSIFPMQTPLYGEPTAPTQPYYLNTSSGLPLLELPPAVLRRGPLALPYGGGLYWRVLPLWLIRLLLDRASAPQVTYLHPWELNPAPLPLPPGLPFLSRLCLCYGLAGASKRLAHLLRHVRFVPFAELLPTWQQQIGLPTLQMAGDD